MVLEQEIAGPPLDMGTHADAMGGVPDGEGEFAREPVPVRHPPPPAVAGWARRHPITEVSTYTTV
jgi:hypothetical protein